MKKQRTTITRLIAFVLLIAVLFAAWIAFNAGSEWSLPF
jgi:hypothetical protein